MSACFGRFSPPPSFSCTSASLAMLSSMAGLPPPLELPTSNGVDNLLNFLVRQWWTAPCRVPGAYQFKDDPGIDVATKQMAGQSRDAVIAGALCDAIDNKLTPFGGRGL